MKNITQLMKQAQQMQEKMMKAQEDLEKVEQEGTSGGGLVTITLNGKSVMRRIKIDPSLVSPQEVDVLEDLIIAAFNDAKNKVEAYVAEEMGKLTGGMGLPPGLKLPF